MSVKEALKNLQEKKLDETRELIFKALSEKAAAKLQEMKIEKASTLLGKK